jgi:hypothetical protein
LTLADDARQYARAVSGWKPNWAHPNVISSTGELASVLIAALLLACAAAWLVAWRYRVAMRRLMSAPLAGAAARPAPADAAAPPLTQQTSPMPVSLADNRRAALLLTLLLVGMSCLIAASSASLWLLLSFADEPFRPKRAAVLTLMHLWPVIPVLGLVWHWSRPRLLGALALFCVVCFAVMLWRSIEPRPLELVLGLAVEIGPALAMIALLFMGSATRAVAPWLLPPFIGLMWASTLGVDALAALVEQRSPLLMNLPSWLGATNVIVLFALLPWAIAWWPLRRLGRWLARAYARQQLSELMVMFTSIWAVSQVVQAVTVASSVGWRGIAMLLPLAWIPLVMTLNARVQRSPGRPPTLLVLRVFQHDAQVQALFDHVIERWRLSGNTVLIAGTDLADRTLDGDDIFTFLDGELASRFIRNAAEVAPRLAGFQLAPDADGRHRVNECYCHDTTWQDALHALVRASEVVLMDLRGFQARNAGCAYELGTLAQAPRALRVTVLVDAQTDRAAAAAAVLGAAPERFRWIDAARVDANTRREVLASLFAP